jgi:NAD+ kinase
MGEKFKNIAIYYNTRHQLSRDLVCKIGQICDHNGVQISVSDIDPSVCVVFQIPDFKPDLIIVIGGDGTFLCAARNFAEKNIPILGINSGNLGFLSQVSITTLKENIQRLLDGDYRIEERLMLEAIEEGVDLPKISTALNDIVIKRGTLSSPLIVSVFIGNEVINDFLGDGIIVSTPTGSTAYNLSVGGPIISPGMKAMVISPIASHSLAIRPLVIPDDQIVKIKIMNDPGHIIISADGHDHSELRKDSIVTVKRKHCKAKMVLLGKNEDNFYRILREKLHWGIFPGRCPEIVRPINTDPTES